MPVRLGSFRKLYFQYLPLLLRAPKPAPSTQCPCTRWLCRGDVQTISPHRQKTCAHRKRGERLTVDGQKLAPLKTALLCGDDEGFSAPHSPPPPRSPGFNVAFPRLRCWVVLNFCPLAPTPVSRFSNIEGRGARGDTTPVVSSRQTDVLKTGANFCPSSEYFAAAARVPLHLYAFVSAAR